MPQNCIFCNRPGKKTKEHLWPVWMHPYLSRQGELKHKRGQLTSLLGEEVSSKYLERQGHLSSIRLRVVCKICNSGWMSRLESKTKPILVNILTENSVLLTASELETLAQWIAMKAITGEHAEPEIFVTPISDRIVFQSELEIPSYFEIYIGSHNHAENTAWLRRSHTMALSPNGPTPPLNGLQRNTQTIAMLCGPIFILVIAIRLEGIKPKDIFQFKKLKKIFPLSNCELNWPTAPIINQSDLSRFSNILDELGNLPNVHHLPEIP